MIKNLLDMDKPEEKTGKPASKEVISVFSAESPAVREPEASNSMMETIRRSGLAYSAAIALAASVVFMLILGWGADLLFETSPWGIVLGILIGAGIGFVQFFRINAQIFRK